MGTINMKEFIKKHLKSLLKMFIIMLIIITIIILFTGTLFDKSQIMDELNYDVVLMEDGSARITETWDVYISYTNTLFRDFNKIGSSFDNITDVTVKDLQTGKILQQIDEKMYHVTTDCYYALYVNSSNFEIAWGTGMENRIGKKQYQISYTVLNVVKDYNDCEEFYWKLLSEENAIPVKKVTGKITMPDNVSKIENLKAWGHGPLNGNIKIASKNSIEFSVDNLEAGRMLEVRAVTTEDMFDVNSSKIRNYSYLNTIMQEENKWANESNDVANYFYIILLIIYVIAIIINLIQVIKAYKINKKKDDGIIHSDIKYYRGIPREENATPPEASYLYFFKKDKQDTMQHQSDIVSATFLNLALKGYISFRTVDKNVYVNILKGSNGLNRDEEAVYEILNGTYKMQGGEFEISKINTFAKNNYTKYSQLINKMVNESRESMYRQELVDKADEKLYKKSSSANDKYYFLVGAVKILIIALIIGLLPIFNRAYINAFGVGFVGGFITIAIIFLPLIATLLVKFKIRSKIQSKIAVLTQKGTEEQEKWKGLAKFMEEFSLIKEREVPELALWEKYLVYATAFGIADKVIEQMKAKYPEVFVEEYWNDENLQKYQVLNFATSNIIYGVSNYHPLSVLNSSTDRAYSTSLSEIAKHSSSSGSGGGGGFSGGGRRPVAEADGMGRKIVKNSYNKFVCAI